MRLLITLLLLLISCGSFADPYKILSLNTPTIQIGHKNLRKGDVFDSKSKIVWSSKKQAMRIQNTRTHEIFVLAAQMKKVKNNIIEYYIAENRLSSRGSGGLELEELQEYFSNPIYFLDVLELETSLEINENHYFILEYTNDSGIVRLNLPIENKDLCIPRSVFKMHLEDQNFTGKLYYQNASELITVSDNLQIQILPLE